MIVEQSNSIINEVSRALLGKRDVVEKALMAIYAGGHILLEDVPGTGKTTLALALSRALGLDFKRVQFTPDTLPSDITGFTMYDRDAGTFRFVWGAVNCNMLLGDEINRTSAKTQSALLEVMEERAVTIDGQTHPVPRPFVCAATLARHATTVMTGIASSAAAAASAAALAVSTNTTSSSTTDMT